MTNRGRTAVVTGAGSGIGRALAVELARRGSNVAISDIDALTLAETAEACKKTGAEVRTYELDVADRGAVLQHAEEVRRDFGGAHLVVNNAGVALAATVEEMTWEDYDWLMGINLGGVVNGTKAFLPLLLESGDADTKSHLVNVSSVFGLLAAPTQSAYNAAKFAVRGFTEALRQEMVMTRRPVGVHCVHPGGIDTNIARNARSADSMTMPPDERAREFRKVARTSPARAARIILKGVEKDRARILVGPDAYLYDAVPRVLGSAYEGIAARGMRALAPRYGIEVEGKDA